MDSVSLAESVLHQWLLLTTVKEMSEPEHEVTGYDPCSSSSSSGGLALAVAVPAPAVVIMKLNLSEVHLYISSCVKHI